MNKMVVIGMKFGIDGLNVAEFEGVFDDLLDELSDLEDTHEAFMDSAVSVDAAAMTVKIEVTARGETFEDAEATATSCIRAAIHATGGDTSSWGGEINLQEKKSRLVPA